MNVGAFIYLLPFTLVIAPRKVIFFDRFSLTFPLVLPQKRYFPHFINSLHSTSPLLMHNATLFILLNQSLNPSKPSLLWYGFITAHENWSAFKEGNIRRAEVRDMEGRGIERVQERWWVLSIIRYFSPRYQFPSSGKPLFLFLLRWNITEILFYLRCQYRLQIRFILNCSRYKFWSHVNFNLVDQDNHKILRVIDFQCLIVVVHLRDSLPLIAAFLYLPVNVESINVANEMKTFNNFNNFFSIWGEKLCLFGNLHIFR